LVRGNICYNCERELERWYVEEGDLTISSEKIVCPYCGWQLEGAMEFHNSDEGEGDSRDD
jgi:DNA-directed RNA polymerase subunit RPC12/RpoP